MLAGAASLALSFPAHRRMASAKEVPMPLTLQHLTYTYPSCVEPALADLSATLPCGWTGLVGDNGCGKSTSPV